MWQVPPRSGQKLPSNCWMSHIQEIDILRAVRGTQAEGRTQTERVFAGEVLGLLSETIPSAYGSRLRFRRRVELCYSSALAWQDLRDAPEEWCSLCPAN